MTPQQVLAAGGIVAGPPAGALSDVDAITARPYRHEALGDRVVVRLVPAALGEAEDLAADFLGLVPAGAPVVVGTGPQQALGFPAWALVHDPGNGRHALALVKEMERYARMAATKPGNADAGYIELAARLDRAAPHFLPTFWEQAGRAFLAAENGRMAGTCFGRAREAEQSHALTVDEERLAAVHLEFALGGGLTAKSLTQYGREVAARRERGEAYQRFRSVAVRRISGGLPPHLGLADDLKRLARAAGLDPETQLREFIVEVIALPALAKASFGFWKAFVRPLTVAAKLDAAVPLALLAIMPDPPGRSVDITDEWVGLLIATRATAGLLATDSEAVATGGAGRWLNRLIASRQRRPWQAPGRSAELLTLVERMLPRLRAEGAEIVTHHFRAFEIDLTDLLLAGGVAVAVPDRIDCSVDGWLNDRGAGARDLMALAGHDGFGPALGLSAVLVAHSRACGGSRPKPQGEAALAGIVGVAGLRAALERTLAGLVTGAVDASLEWLSDLLHTVGLFELVAGRGLDAGVLRPLASADVAAALARTLRVGLVEEYGWPELEAATAAMGPAQNTSITWPFLSRVVDGVALAFGPAGVAAEHTLPPGLRGTTVSYVDGQFFVTHYTIGHRNAYWSNNPGDVFDADAYPSEIYGLTAPARVTLPGGGVTTGDLPWRAGDRAVPSPHAVITDGYAYWRFERDYTHGTTVDRWREYDPQTGKGGRVSVPEFLQRPGVHLGRSWLLTAPAEYADSPLGAAAGLVGWRVRAGADGALLGEGIDGRSVEWRDDDAHRALGRQTIGRALAGAIRMPGSNDLYPVVQVGDTAEVWTADGAVPASRYRGGLPLLMWHALRPRDEAASAALRAVTDETVRGLLEAVAAALRPESKRDERLDAARQALAGTPLASGHPALATALAEYLLRAHDIADRLANLGPATGPVMVAPSRTIDVAEVTAAVSVFRRPTRNGSMFYKRIEDGATLLAQIAAAGAILRGVEPPLGTPFPRQRLAGEWNWTEALRWPAALAARAAGAATGERAREALLVLLETFADNGLLVATGEVRIVTGVVGRPMDERDLPDPVGCVLSGPGRRGVVVHRDSSRDYSTGRVTYDNTFIERDQSGRFGPIEGYSLVDDHRPSGLDADQARTLCQRIRADGPPAWRPERVTDLAERVGISAAEAALLLAGLPGVPSYEANFLPAPVRAMLGLSVAQARAARDRLAALDPDVRARLLSAAVPVEIEALWTVGPDVDAVAAVWRDAVGARATVDSDVLIELGRLLGYHDAAPIVDLLADPGTGELGDRHLSPLATALAFLAYRLPPGDPMRAALPSAYRAIRERLADPSFALRFYHHGELPALPALRRTSDSSYHAELLPHRLTGQDDPVLRMLDRADLAFLLSPRSEALMAWIETPAPEGWPHDPRVSVPDLVEAVVKRYGLGADAATYYLQLLALPDPTDRNVQRWNGWTPARLKQAASELASTDLVVAAKRERAGRGLFVPGGWTALKAPHLPLETWKVERLELGSEPLLLLDRTPAQLFGQAWILADAGDGPRYTSLGGGA